MTPRPAIFLLLLAMLSVINVKAQKCGNDFKTIKVSDTKGKSIRKVTIEIVARMTNEEYKVWHHDAVKISVPDAKAVIKRKLPITFTKDIECQNPLTQHLGKTKVKNLDEQKPPSLENLGFCTVETIFEPLLLKVYAPGYLTDYRNFMFGL